MEKKHIFNFHVLLPNVCKKIGLVIVLLCATTAIAAFRINKTYTEDQKEIIKTITTSLFILGLFLIAWSKDKNEDDLTFNMRLSSLSLHFLLLY